MAKNLKINIKNTQIAQAVNLGNLKKNLSKKKDSSEDDSKKELVKPVEEAKETPRKKARTKSAFTEGSQPASETISETTPNEPIEVESAKERVVEEAPPAKPVARDMPKTTEPKIEAVQPTAPEKVVETTQPEVKAAPAPEAPKEPEAKPHDHRAHDQRHAREPRHEPRTDDRRHYDRSDRNPQDRRDTRPPLRPEVRPQPRPDYSNKVISSHHNLLQPKTHTFLKDLPVREKFGPTGKHVKDLIPPKKPTPPPGQARDHSRPGGPHGDRPPREGGPHGAPGGYRGPRPPGQRPYPPRPQTPAPAQPAPAAGDADKEKKAKFREYRDLKPAKRTEASKFDSRDRQGLSASEDDARWRKRKLAKQSREEEDATIRPTQLKIRLPIMLKDLAAEMKLKASQLVQKLFLQGIIVTLNSVLDDETTVQLLGHEFGCEITIDTSKADRIRITDKTIQQEVKESPAEHLVIRPPIVAFMGHVDHGKTSLIDYIRKSNRAAGEAGAITQHIGAFMCHTAVGDITFLDTPGHEAFSAMRARGANITDIVVLVVAGDEGIRQQTVEAIQHAKAAGVVIVVAINKSDKPNFNPETVYRQLSEHDLLPESWGGQTITVNCSAVTGDGVKELLEMLALQAEVLELKANTKSRARGTVIESELHKGLGSKATILVQNGTLKKGDALVFESYWGRVKTMYDENGKELDTAGPSHAVEITGLSGLPDAGQEFIVVQNEKEAKEISDMRTEGIRQLNLLQKKKMSMESLLSQASESGKKILNIVLRADVQGSLEALRVALGKITSSKAELNIIFSGVGEISESDVQLAAASKAVILGFHTQIESHADQFVKELGVIVKLHDIIYHAVDDVKALMAGLLDKISVETERGKALVKATFKSSQLGVIAGCQVIEGTINRNHLIRIKRGNELVFKGSIASLKKVKEDVREVSKGIECGILINNFNDAKENDIIESYEITYLTQEL